MSGAQRVGFQRAATVSDNASSSARVAGGAEPRCQRTMKSQRALASETGTKTAPGCVKVRKHEIAAWSAWTETFVENDVETREWLAGRVQTMDVRRADIAALFDYLDLDDYLSFGGQAYILTQPSTRLMAQRFMQTVLTPSVLAPLQQRIAELEAQLKTNH